MKPHRSSFIADARRADAGDSDDTVTWCRGEAGVTRHDGRPGTAMPRWSRARHRARLAFRGLRRPAARRSRVANVLDAREDDALFHQKTPEGLKALAKPARRRDTRSSGGTIANLGYSWRMLKPNKLKKRENADSAARTRGSFDNYCNSGMSQKCRINHVRHLDSYVADARGSLSSPPEVKE